MSERLEKLHKLHALDPADPFCTYGIALEHAKLGQLDQALAWLDKTITLDAQYCYAYFQKGKLLSEAGQEDQAREVLRLGMEAALKTGDTHAHSEIASLLDSI